MPALLDASLQVHSLLLPFRLLQAFLWVCCQMGLRIIVHDIHVVNTISPILKEVTDQEVSLL